MYESLTFVVLYRLSGLKGNNSNSGSALSSTFFVGFFWPEIVPEGTVHNTVN